MQDDDANQRRSTGYFSDDMVSRNDLISNLRARGLDCGVDSPLLAANRLSENQTDNRLNASGFGFVDEPTGASAAQAALTASFAVVLLAVL